MDASLETRMAAIRTIATLGRAAREEAGIKVRQPLERLVCVAAGVDEAALRELLPLLEAELNVKRVEFATSGAQLVRLEAKRQFQIAFAVQSAQGKLPAHFANAGGFLFHDEHVLGHFNAAKKPF